MDDFATSSTHRPAPTYINQIDGLLFIHEMHISTPICLSIYIYTYIDYKRKVMDILMCFLLCHHAFSFLKALTERKNLT